MTDEAIVSLNNFEAEEAVLGSVLINPDSIFDISHFLTPDHFYRQINGSIFAAMQHLAQNKIPIDPITLIDEIGRRDQLEGIGGPGYIASLINTVPTSINIEAYARIVEDMATRRRILTAASTAANLALDKEKPLDEVVSEAENALFQISHNRASHRVKHIRDVANEHMEMLGMIQETGAFPTVSTGFVDLDRALSAGGMEKGQLIMIPGDTGMGKSALLLNILANAAKKGHSAAMFTLEMTDHQMFQRQVAADSKIPVSKLKQANLTDEELSRYYQHVGELSILNFHIDESAFITPMTLLSKCRRIQARYGLDVVGVDYLALMSADGEFHNETLRLGSISRALKLIAKDLNVVMIVCAQLNAKQISARMDKRPQLGDLRWSSDPNNDSDVVMFVYRDEYYNKDTSDRPNIGEVIFGKQREGWTPTVDLYWNGELMSFYTLSRQEINLGTYEETPAAHAAGIFD